MYFSRIFEKSLADQNKLKLVFTLLRSTQGRDTVFLLRFYTFKELADILYLDNKNFFYVTTVSKDILVNKYVWLFPYYKKNVVSTFRLFSFTFFHSKNEHFNIFSLLLQLSLSTIKFAILLETFLHFLKISQYRHYETVKIGTNL